MPSLSLQLQMHPSSGVPIYRQLIDQFRALIAAGTLSPGTMLPSVRQLASDLEVNMMTVSKAYGRLEQEGVVERIRGTGMRVKTPCGVDPVARRRTELEPLAVALAERSAQLGLSLEEALDLVRETLAKHLPQESTTSIDH